MAAASTRWSAPAANVTWQITGDGSGNVAGVEFTDFENLTGAPDNCDTFSFARNARISGTVDGGEGGFDTLVLDAAGGVVDATGFDPHSGLIVIDGVRYAYTGLEPVTIAAPTSLTVNGTAGDDAATLTAHATLDGWFTFAGATFETIHFERPSVSLLVDALGGDDTVTVTGTSRELDFGSIPVTIRAERIVVDGATLTTTGALVLDAEAVDNGSPTLIVVDWVTDAPNASVRLVNGATVRGGSVELGAGPRR